MYLAIILSFFCITRNACNNSWSCLDFFLFFDNSSTPTAAAATDGDLDFAADASGRPQSKLKTGAAPGSHSSTIEIGAPITTAPFPAGTIDEAGGVTTGCNTTGTALPAAGPIPNPGATITGTAAAAAAAAAPAAAGLILNIIFLVGFTDPSDEEDHAALGCIIATAPDFAPFPAGAAATAAGATAAAATAPFAFDEAGGVTTGCNTTGTAVPAAGPRPNTDATITGAAAGAPVPAAGLI